MCDRSFDGRQLIGAFEYIEQDEMFCCDSETHSIKIVCIVPCASSFLRVATIGDLTGRKD